MSSQEQLHSYEEQHLIENSKNNKRQIRMREDMQDVQTLFYLGVEKRMLELHIFQFFSTAEDIYRINTKRHNGKEKG